MALAVISAAVVILTAGYILWAIQRVYLGAEYKGPHPEALTPMTFRELAIAAPLLALAILFGVYPQALFELHAAVGRQDGRSNWPSGPKQQRTGRPAPRAGDRRANRRNRRQSSTHEVTTDRQHRSDSDSSSSFSDVSIPP